MGSRHLAYNDNDNGESNTGYLMGDIGVESPSAPPTSPSYVLFACCRFEGEEVLGLTSRSTDLMYGLFTIVLVDSLTRETPRVWAGMRMQGYEHA